MNNRRPDKPAEVTLADLVVQERLARMVGRDVAAQLIAKIKQAHRFSFDDNAVRRIAEVCRDVPELLIEHQQFARAPYDMLWFELTEQPFWQIMHPDLPYDDHKGDHRVGFLVDHGTVYSFASDHQEPKATAALFPVRYHLHQPFELDDQIAFCRTFRTSRMLLDSFLWGSPVDRLSEHHKRALRAAHSCDLIPSTTPALMKRLPELGHKVLAGANGDLRNVIATLLILNRPSLITYIKDVSSHRSLHHRIVTIDLDLRPIIREVGQAVDPREVRRHEVRGHYCHNQATRDGARRGCLHEWRADPAYPADDVDHWWCQRCTGKRWWRHHHTRGSAEIGFVTHDYQVVAEPKIIV